jgi:transcriptional regulator with XRE-family HTH domain
MPKKSSAHPQAPEDAHVVPEWAKKVKAYREEAKKTQVEVEKALKATVNTLSLVENGHREFTPTQRHLFFELVGKPEDSSIPTKVRDLVPSGPKKAIKPAKPATAPKVGKAAKAPVASPMFQLAPDLQGAAPAPTEEVIAPTSPTDQPRPRSRRVRKTAVAPAPVPPAPAKQTPVVSMEPAPNQGPSPVKEAVLRDISRILGNPGLSDNQAKRLHGLFTSLAINALLGD